MGYRILLVFLLLGWQAANGSVVLTVQPLGQAGSSFSASVAISGLSPGINLSSYDLSLGFDDSLLQFDHAQLDQQLSLGGPGQSLPLVTLIGNAVNVSEFSLDDAATLAQQPSQFTLFTLYWNVIATGTSNLQLHINSLSDAQAYPLLADAVDASASLVAVPVPSLIGIYAALLGLALSKRRLLA